MNIYITNEGAIIISISISILLSATIWLTKTWIGARIDKSIQHHYQKELEDYKTSRLRRERTELISRLFSLWIKYRGRESVILSNEELIERYYELNRMSLELSLWVEDVKLLNDVMSRLQNRDNAKSIYEIMGEVRALILEKSDDFNPKNITLWPVDDEIEKIFGRLK